MAEVTEMAVWFELVKSQNTSPAGGVDPLGSGFSVLR